MLTGKNKERFESYLSNVFKPNYSLWSRTLEFYSLPLSMQFGVIQDYADSLRYSLSCGHNGDNFTYHVKPHDCPVYQSRTKETRDEARKAAIKAFDEIVNNEWRNGLL